MKASWDRERDPLVALGRGQQGLFEDFVRVEAATLIGFFQRLGGSRVEAEDLTQEVFLKLYRQASHYQPQGSFEAFALRIARNAWIDRRRRAAARVPARPFSVLDHELPGRSEPEAPSVEPGQALSQAEDRERVVRALQRLSANHAMIFELAVVQGRPYPEIAAELEIPVGTVKSRVFHALRHLRAELQDEPGSAPRNADGAAAARAVRPLHGRLGGSP